MALIERRSGPAKPIDGTSGEDAFLACMSLLFQEINKLANLIKLSRMELVKVLLLVSLSLVMLHVLRSDAMACDGTAFKFIDDASISAAIAKARTRTLATRPFPLDRLDATVLVTTSDPSSWRRGSFNPFEVAYPARFSLPLL